MVMLGDGRTARDRVELGVAVISRLEERRRALLDQREFAIAAADAEQSSFAQRRSGLAHEIAADRWRDRDPARAPRASRAAAWSARTGSKASDFFPRPRSTGNATRHSTRNRDWSNCNARDRRYCAIPWHWSSSRRARFRAGARKSRRSRCSGRPSTRSASSESRNSTRPSSHPRRALSPRCSWNRARWWSPGTPLAAIVPSNATLEAHCCTRRRDRSGSCTKAKRSCCATSPIRTRSSACTARRSSRYRAIPMLPGELGFTPVDGTREPVYRIKAALDSQAIRAYDRFERAAARHAARGRRAARPAAPDRVDLRAAPGARRKDVMDLDRGPAASAAGRRLPVILQTEAAECGLACLAMVACFHGHRIDLAGLRRRFTVSLKGATLADLMQVAGRCISRRARCGSSWRSCRSCERPASCTGT